MFTTEQVKNLLITSPNYKPKFLRRKRGGREIKLEVGQEPAPKQGVLPTWADFPSVSDRDGFYNTVVVGVQLLVNQKLGTAFVVRREWYYAPQRRRKMGEGFIVEGGDPPSVLECAYTLKGEYIGSVATARRLCFKYGINPERREASHSVCSIGYSPSKKLWYGWSHRAIKGCKKREQAAKFAESVS